MLKPSEIFAGLLERAEPLSLVLPRSPYEQLTLVLNMGDRKVGLILDGGEELLHHFAEVQSQNDWSGVIIPGVEIELDLYSLFDVSGCYPPRGSMIREGNTLGVQTSVLGRRFAHQGGTIQVMDGLPACDINQRACFTKWRIVLGQGTDKRVLHAVDVTPASS